MYHPKLFVQGNSFTDRGISETLRRLGPKLIWNKDKEVALDIGCGPGEVTKELIFPLLPKKSSLMVGIDKVDTMVEYARKHYSNDAITFETQDIMQLYKSKLVSDDTFTKVFSFYCLNWVLDYDTCLKNIFNLMTKNGQALLGFIAHSSHHEMHRTMSRRDKWKMYLHDVEDIIPKYQNFQGNPAEDFRVKALRAGFQVEHCEVEESIHNFEPPIETAKKFFDSLNTFSIRMLPSEKDEYLEECFEEILKLSSTNAKGGLAMIYKNLEVVLKKPN